MEDLIDFIGRALAAVCISTLFTLMVGGLIWLLIG